MAKSKGVFVIDVARCNGCHNCQIACKDEHVTNDWTPIAKPQPEIGQFWIECTEKVRGTVPKLKVAYRPNLCMHCAEAPCVKACPIEGALYYREDGLVIVDPVKCTGCRLCVDACPVSNTNQHFVGPQALAQAYRYNSDSRDQGEKDRLDHLDSMDGVWGCEFAGACSEVCPKGVDPALTIQQMKIDLMKRRLLGRGSGEKRAR